MEDTLSMLMFQTTPINTLFIARTRQSIATNNGAGFSRKQPDAHYEKFRVLISVGIRNLKIVTKFFCCS